MSKVIVFEKARRRLRPRILTPEQREQLRVQVQALVDQHGKRAVLRVARLLKKDEERRWAEIERQ